MMTVMLMMSSYYITIMQQIDRQSESFIFDEHKTSYVLTNIGAVLQTHCCPHISNNVTTSSKLQAPWKYQANYIPKPRYETVTSIGQMKHAIMFRVLTPTQPNKSHRPNFHSYTTCMLGWVIDVALQLSFVIVYT